MFNSDYDTLKREEHDIIIQEYNNIIQEFKRELGICKTEQNDIRSELQALHVENKDSSDAVRDYISRVHLEECGNENVHDKIITNLKEQIAVLQMEKDSAIQLWQVSMKAIDALEQELKTRPIDNREVKFYEEQLKDVRQSYSEAIKALESRLVQAKENFAKQQSLWMTSKETINTLKREKQEVMKKLQDFQQDSQQKDRNSQQTMQSLTEELSVAKAEIQRINHLKSDLERRLSESKRIASNLMAKNEETKCKMSEALDLVESAINEKNLILQREAHVVDQNAKLEARLASVANEHIIQMREEIARLKDAHEHNANKYLVEIKDLKSELRRKVTILERSEKENKLTKEELEKVRRDSESFLHKSPKILNFEQALKQEDFQLQSCDETCTKHHSEMQRLQEKIINLEEKLTISNKRLKEIQRRNSTDVQNHVELTDERTKDAIDRYVNLESQLIKATDDKEYLTTQLKSLQLAFDREIHKRDYERCASENKIRELEANLQKTNYITENKSVTNVSPVQISSLSHHADTTNKHILDIRVENMDNNRQSMLAEQFSKQREHFDKKIKEMSQHVKVHQKLSRRWRDEAKTLTAQFQTKSKELRGKINSLRKENDELHKALMLCKQQFTEYKTDTVHSYIQESEIR